MSDFAKWSLVVLKAPHVFSCLIDYYRNGPPQPSWNLKFYLFFNFFKSMMAAAAQDIETAQVMSSAANKVVDDSIAVDELLLSNLFRKKSEVYIDKILKDYNHVLLDDWKSVNIGDGLEAEWVYVKEEGEANDNQKKKYDKVVLHLHGGAYMLCTPASYRHVTSRFAKLTNARLFAINYRLSPQNQFPAALHDAITAYNYLINPPTDAEFQPIDPKNIVIMGDSAGGGLTMATLLAIRDSKLPLPAGAIVLSPWIDLTHSMPSFFDKKYDESDYLPSTPFNCLKSPAMEEFERKASELSEKIRLNADDKPKFWHESFDYEGRAHLYVSNEGLAIPYVSPVLAESLGDLPPILVQVGDVERLRDEGVYLAFKASDPEKYNAPYYNVEKFENSPYKTPTKVLLEVYEEMPHDFQLLPSNMSTKTSFKQISEFIGQVLSGEEKVKESKFSRITTKGEIIEGLKEEHYKLLECENVGIVRDIGRKIVLNNHNNNNNSYKNMAKFSLYAVLLMTILGYFI